MSVTSPKPPTKQKLSSSTISTYFPDVTTQHNKVSPRSQLHLSLIPLIASQFHPGTGYTTSSTKHNNFESDRGQQLERMGPLSLSSAFTSPYSGTFQNKISKKKDGTRDTYLKDKKDILKFFPPNNFLTLSGKSFHIRSNSTNHSTAGTPRKDPEIKLTGNTEVKSYRCPTGEEMPAGSDNLLIMLEMKKLEVRELKQFLSKTSKRVHELSTVKEKEEVPQMKEKLEQYDTAIDLYLKLLEKFPQNKSPAPDSIRSHKYQAQSHRQKDDDCQPQETTSRSMNRLFHEISLVTKGNPNQPDQPFGSKLSSKNKSMSSPNGLGQQIEFRNDQQEESQGKILAIKSLKSMYSSNSSTRSNVKFRLGRHPSKSISRFVLAKSPESTQAENEGTNVYAISSKGHLGKTNTTEADSKTCGISSESVTEEVLRKDRNSFADQDLIGLAGRLKRVVQNYSEQNAKLKEDTLKLMEMIDELEAKKASTRKSLG